MQTERQIDSSAMPKIVPQADSGESTSKRGGTQPGAGRKPNLAKILLKGVLRTTILAAVENVDVAAIIIVLLKSKREQTRIEALHFVFDRVIGKPKQDLTLSGGIVHTHTRSNSGVTSQGSFGEARAVLQRDNREVRYASP